VSEIVFRRPPSPEDAARPRSLWLQEALADDKLELPKLTGTERADVCIVGGGFAGLWTALNLKADDPSLDVVLLEADRCGTGPSGRNAGVAMSWWGKFSTLKKLCGSEEARRLADASVDAITAIGRFCEENDIDAHFHHDGFVWTARWRAAPTHQASWPACSRNTAPRCNPRRWCVASRESPPRAAFASSSTPPSLASL
jgi:glycine/D-amino acid oxidase-like deaminating enzyme